MKRNKWKKNYESMKERCNNPNNKGYKYYGGKGIKVLLTPEEMEFIWNRDKAYLMKIPSVDRINSNGNYELSNCRFLEMEENRKRKGMDNGTAKLTDKDIPEIRKLLSEGKSCIYIGKKYNISCVSINNIKNRKNWTHIN